MKANAPEKLYYAPYGDIREDYPITDNDIEYTLTDAFIKKAVEWLKCQDEMVGISFQEDFIERFKNYMKGE